MVDVDHPNDEVGLVDLVDDPVGTDPRRVKAGQFAHQRLADPVRVLKNGTKRGTFYTRGAELEALVKAIRDARDPRDESNPFASAP